MTQKMHPTRVAICRLMKDGRERTISDIGNYVEDKPQAISAHLKMLVKWGLITVERPYHNYMTYRRADMEPRE